ncbi:unnamed protein product [Vicia faba]|uniref:Uncharacterized protein n=1 Tax=Vicia faba TaxID=3906 RepID=A0AAV0YMJ3_VICFA|nr:unnamed protein product [Vicia faba]
MSNEKWEELDLRASNKIHMFLAKNILANVLGTSSLKELWEKLEGLYQEKIQFELDSFLLHPRFASVSTTRGDLGHLQQQRHGNEVIYDIGNDVGLFVDYF